MLIISFFCYFLPSPFSFLVFFIRLQVERETSSLPSAEAHQTSRKDRSAQFGSPNWRLEAVPVTLPRAPLYEVPASRNFSSQEVKEMMEYGGENGDRRKGD